MRTQVLVSAVAVVLSLVGCGPLPGADAGVDAGSDAGVADAGIRRINGTGNTLLQQGTRFVVAGNTATTDSDMIIARYEADGGVDPTFGTGGSVLIHYPPYVNELLRDAGLPYEYKSSAALAIAAQGDKLVVAGTSGALGLNYGGFALARLSADGQLDPTFGVDGHTSLRQSVEGALALSVAVRADGAIYAAGWVQTSAGTYTDYALARFTRDGVLDPSFGGPQGVIANVGVREAARAIVLQGSKVVVGGGDDFIAARFNDDGTLDTTFGTAGVARNTGGAAYNFRGLADGKLLLVGARKDMTGLSTLKLVRYTSEGQLDTTFGTAGVAETPVDNELVTTVGLDVSSDGRILVNVTGPAAVIRNPYLSVVRLSANGALDTSFGTGGKLELGVDLPLFGTFYPAASNRSLVVGDTLYFTDVNVFTGNREPVIVFGAAPVR